MTTLPSFECIVFDFDGTLSRLNIDFGDMRRKVLGLAGRYGISDDSLRNHYVLEMTDEVRRILEDENRDTDARLFAEHAFRMIRAIELESAGTGSLFAGIRELFAGLRLRRIRTGIITRNCREAVLTVWPDAERCGDILITRDGLSNVKPHPAHLHAALSLLGADPARAAMVGDHPMDIRVGRSAGTFTIGVLSGNSTEWELRDAGADLVIDRASSLLGHLTL